MKRKPLPTEYNDLLIDIGNMLQTIKGQFNEDIFNKDTGRLIANADKNKQRKCKKSVKALKRVQKALTKISSKFMEEIKEE